MIENSDEVVLLNHVSTEEIKAFARETLLRFDIPKNLKQRFLDIAHGKKLENNISYKLIWKTESKHILIIKQEFGFGTVSIGSDESYVYYKTLKRIAKEVSKE